MTKFIKLQKLKSKIKTIFCLLLYLCIYYHVYVFVIRCISGNQHQSQIIQFCSLFFSQFFADYSLKIKL